ncbi:MAG: G1 family glutamic endopeptidase [Steroidobacteraceae bacterium]
MRKLVLLCLLGGVGLMALAASAMAAPIATPPVDCTGFFNPYDYTAAAISACGYQTFPLTDVQALPGGGSRYDYDVNGVMERYYVPPPGFDALSATPAQLDEYGLPPQPTDPSAAARWTQQMANLDVATPPPFLTQLHATADSVTFYNWSGYAVTGGSGAFNHAETYYTEPTFYGSRCSSNSEVTWAGIGGYYGSGDDLGQDGTLHNIGGASDHQGWSEIVPGQSIQPQNIFGHPGYQFDASTRRISGGYRFYMYDYYSRKTLAYDVGLNHYSGDSAEAIAERPTSGNSLTNLSNFGTLTFQNTYANGSAINNFTHHGIHMTNPNNGHDLADPSGLGSGGAFTDTQHNCN